MKKFALVGNPNCGKTTLFNLLTGSNAYVGNWPGVTAEKGEGIYKKGSEEVDIVDLPGIYSLSPYTSEEVVSRNFILDEKPDCVINIIDATNLERNLYLTTQIMEIDVPVIIALNMMDAVEKNGDKIDPAYLEKLIGLPVVPISAMKGTGIKELMERAIETAKTPRKACTVLQNSPIAHLVGDVAIALEAKGVEAPLFHAVKLAELDEIEAKMHKDILPMVDAFKATFADDTFGTDIEAIIADARYKHITGEYVKAYTRNPRSDDSRSDKIDKVLTHKWFGIPIFLLLLFAIFHCTFSESFLFSGSWGLPSLEEIGLVIDGEPANFGVKLLACIYDGCIYSPGVIINNLWNDIIVGTIFGLVNGWVELIPAEWAVGLINDGILEGLSSVLSFLPQILTLFLFFSILEDSGYMARVAFILDRLFRKFGLSGRAFMPMIMGFGCSVPAMINTRTLADENEKTATIRVIPFFSCGAKLPILTAISGAIVMKFGWGNADLITYAMYVLGITTAIISVILMRNTTMKGDVPPFIMELPAYHAPLFTSLMIHLWDKAKHFIEKAFTVILASTIAIWFISHFSFDWKMLADEEINNSILAGIGKLLQPVFTPIGFGAQLTEWGWVFAVAAITGLIAKENVVATFGTLAACVAGAILAEDEEGISYVVAMVEATGITIPALLAFIVFNMTTIPCFAAVATAKGELTTAEKFKWTILFWLVASYIASCVVYTVASWWWTIFVWVAVGIVVGLFVHLWNKRKANV